MPYLQAETSIGANATNANLLSGSTYEFLPWDAHIEVALVGAATGLVATVMSGSDVLQEEAAISTANRFPLYPDDFVMEDDAEAGDRLVLRVRNTTGAAVIVRHGVRITPF